MKLLNEQYFPVTLFTVQYISIYDSDQNPTVWLSQGGAQDFKRQGWSTEGKNQNPKNFQGCQHPPPPPKKKKFTNFQALKIQTKKNPRPSIIPVSWNPEYPHCGDYTSKLFLVAFSPGESGGSTLQKSGG